MKRRMNLPMVVFTGLNLLLSLIFFIFCLKLNVIPLKYILLIILILILLNIGSLLLLKNKKIKWLGIILSLIIILLCSIGTYYLSKTDNFLSRTFGNNTNYHNTTYYVITLKDKFNSIEELTNKKIGYYDNAPSLNEAIENLNNEVKTKINSYDNLYNLFNDLDNEDIKAILLEKGLYSFMSEIDNEFDASKYDIIKSYDIKVIDEIESTNTDKNSYNIYIAGLDFTELYTDFNLLITVNRNTHEMLLTSTPRDYYVPIYGKDGKRDLLGYAGVWGINTSVKTMEDIYDIDIDYYIKINTKSLVKLVDILDGVEFCSDISYTTTHATILESYDDSQGQRLYVSKGCRTYSGVEILTIARERKAYYGGDRQRQKNCQQIMINILKKLISSKLITNYSTILDQMDGLYTTNLPKDIVTDLAKDTIEKGMWDITQQSVNGTSSGGYVHLSNVYDHVMIPDEETIKEAISKIKTVEAGK